MKQSNRKGAHIPPTLLSRGAVGFWAAVVLTGAGAGMGAAALTTLLDTVQHVMWPGRDLLDAGTRASAWRHVWVLLGAGVLTGAGQVVLRRLTSGNGIDITEAISEFGGRLPTLRTLGTAVLSILVVGMGASLGREGAPKQVGAVLANAQRSRFATLQSWKEPNLAQYGHHRMRQSIVQVARDLQALPDNRRITRLFRQLLHLTSPHCHASLQFAAFLTKITENCGERGTQSSDLVSPARNFDTRSVVLADRGDRVD